MIPVTSVIDVGCGVGAWLKAFSELGVERILGLDGEYVSRDQMLIPDKCFVPGDLAKLSTLPTGFDLAICTEVLEHLPDAVGCRIVELLATASPIVLFSAAIPGQGGTHHINERWHEHWHRKFELLGFEVFDVLRPRIFNDTEIDWWYKQNLFVYCDKKSESSASAISKLSSCRISLGVDPVSPRVLSKFKSTRGLISQLIFRLRQKFIY